MKKIFAMVCGAVASATVGAAPALADQLDEVKLRGKIIVGIKNDYRPFGFLDKDAALKGFEIDLAKQVAKKILGSEDAIELVPVIASNRIELLNAGRIDLILATLGQNPERAKVIDFTEAYYMMAGIELLSPKDATIQSWEDISGKKLCGVQGNLYNKTITGKYGAETVLFTGTAEMFKAFQDGRCDAIAFDGPILRQKIAEPEWAEKYKIALETFNYIPIAGGVRKDEPAFLKAVNEAILSAEAAGVLVNAEKEFAMGESEYVTKRAADAAAAGH
ncbi:transporter substrate-binding domain-containing protein [Rhizobium sp. ARZ01]|uniref:transporter substrate-binding domain-containing protein n=1 Tax=Rhizobium sp. ARZ01 TaxID=2769313 RepID=UPI001786A655|nr:transporter substrate-binding domain-containing protein [Rhizobium sp. ARZ01]MBD9375700.1 transporter substrate-binding domain-containing protein [Rhizobium sp. ARZ01]